MIPNCLEDHVGTAKEVTTMRKAFGAAVLAVLWLAAAPGRADVASGWQAFLDGDYETAIADLERSPGQQKGPARGGIVVIEDKG